jgi:probable phosphoglycerate mutase
LSKSRLWLVRHGETEWSATGQHTSRTDLALTAAGEKEALALAPVLSGHQFALVLASSTKRALRTAELAGFQPSEDDDLEEWDYGDFEGRTTADIRRTYPGWTIWEGPWPGGETPVQVGERARRVVERARALPGGADALAFAHGHILRVVAAVWLGRPPVDGRMFVLGTATVSVLGWEHEEPAIQHWNVPPPPISPGVQRDL